MAIMSLLAASPQLSFTELRDTLGMTDGNITAHARTLQEAGYIAVTKAFQGLSFPQPPEGGIVTVVYPILFEPPIE